MLSRPPNADKGEEDNQDVTLLPSELFICLSMSAHADKRELDHRIGLAQKRHEALMTKWKDKYLLHSSPADTIPTTNLWRAQQRIVVPPDEELKRNILFNYHSGPMEHPLQLSQWTNRRAPRER
jgi:hypothetical protein